MHILQEFSRPCIFSKLAFLRVIVTLYGFAYAFCDKSTVRKCAYATYFLPVSSRYVSSVRVCVCVCYKCVQAHVCEHARARLHMSACISVCSRVSFFFFFLLSFFPLIIKVYFILQSVECAGKSSKCSLFFFPLSLSLFPFSSFPKFESSRSFFRVYAFHERISTINRVRGKGEKEETFSNFSGDF